jgi:hypothetical protein
MSYNIRLTAETIAFRKDLCSSSSTRPVAGSGLFGKGINEIKREAHRLKRTIEKQPRIWKFHGRRVVRAAEWKRGDWTKLPDEYNILIVHGKSVPEDYLRDYVALMEKLEDPT